MESRARVEARAAELYGETPGPMEGVLHVMAVARENGGLRVMKIGEHAPKSPTDFFVLQLSRARVDAIVVSGSVLRAEPELRYDLVGEGFHAYRADRPPPWLLVLTRSGELPREHPVWRSWARPLVYTGRDTPLDLPAAVPVVRVEAPTPRDAIRHLREDRACSGVSVEAGPRVAVPLYDEPSMIDETMLSVFEGDLRPEARGGAFPSESELERRMRVVGGPTRVEESSGPWTFRRLVRRVSAAPG